jgi:hypothetical protein
MKTFLSPKFSFLGIGVAVRRGCIGVLESYIYIKLKFYRHNIKFDKRIENKDIFTYLYILRHTYLFFFSMANYLNSPYVHN